MDSDRFMVAIGYHGHSFHGSQIQPDVRTVEGALQQALRRLTWWSENCLEISSRTDSGVSVRMNIARIDLPPEVSRKVKPQSIIRALNDHLPVGAVCLFTNRVPQKSRARYANFRKYLYRLEFVEEWPFNPDSEKIRVACSIIEGLHDFTNLSRMEDGRDPIREVQECVPWYEEDGRVIGFSIKSKSFLWNQVRRIAAALSAIASGRIEIPELESALANPEVPVDFGRAPAEGLILWEISHPDLISHLSQELPNPRHFTRRQEDPREYRRWLSSSGYEMSNLMESEWRARLISN